MAIPIANLFKESLNPSDDIHCLPRTKDLEEMALSWDDIGIAISDIPELPFPSANSSFFENDINSVMNCFVYPINSPEFLEIPTVVRPYLNSRKKVAIIDIQKSSGRV